MILQQRILQRNDAARKVGLEPSSPFRHSVSQTLNKSQRKKKNNQNEEKKKKEEKKGKKTTKKVNTKQYKAVKKKPAAK